MDAIDAAAGEFDFIVGNPPYVRRDDIMQLQREVREHEPHIALFSPEDELSIYRRIVAGGEELLRSGGYLILEIGLGMEEDVLGLFGAAWQKLPTRADLQGIPRTIVTRKI
jgi:release factor glutamine methyltransferase